MPAKKTTAKKGAKKGAKKPAAKKGGKKKAPTKAEKIAQATGMRVADVKQIMDGSPDPETGTEYSAAMIEAVEEAS